MNWFAIITCLIMAIAGIASAYMLYVSGPIDEKINVVVPDSLVA